MISVQFFYIIFITLLTLTTLSKLGLLLLNIKHITKHFDRVPSQFQDKITLEEHQKAQNYTITKNKLSIFNIFLNIGVLLFWLFTGALNTLSQQIITFFPNLSEVTLAIVIILSFSFINMLIDLPVSIYTTFVIEEKYGFNKTSPKIFIIDLLKGLALSMIIGIPLLSLIFYFIQYSGNLWWLYAWLLIITFQFVMLWAYPRFIAPLFNKFTPMQDSELIAQINKLTEKCKINFKDYYVMNASLRSSHGNAYFTGFGNNRRIVFFDTLLETLNRDQVLAVLAHELGHLVKGHIKKHLIIYSLVLLFGLYLLGVLFSSPLMYEAFHIVNSSPAVGLIVFTLILPVFTYFLSPFGTWLSRKNEFEADEFAAKHANPKDLIEALIKMYKDNSSSLTPHPWYSKFYYSHPPATERTKFLESFLKKS